MNLMDASAIFNLFQTGKYSVLIVGTTLSIGPLLGIISMIRLRYKNESLLMCHGKK